MQPLTPRSYLHLKDATSCTTFVITNLLSVRQLTTAIIQTNHNRIAADRLYETQC